MKISFVGGGVMCEALVSGILKSSLAESSDVVVSDPSVDRRSHLEDLYSIETVSNNTDLIDRDGIIVIAVKPQILSYVLSDLDGRLRADRTVASIVAGVNAKTLKDGLSHESIVRIMPNTPAQIGSGMTVWTATETVSETDRADISNMIETLGEGYYVNDEKLIDMSTALSASGPAYVFLFLEALIDAGVYLGMTRDMARELAIETVIGSARLVRESGKHPAVLKDMVTSPGGTTIEALVSMENDCFRAAVINAVRSAFERSIELGNQ